MRLVDASNSLTAGVLHDRFLHAMIEAAHAVGYRITLFTAPDSTAETRAFEDLLSEANVDGFVVIGTHPGDIRTEWLSEKGIPFVTFGRQWDQSQTAHAWADVDGAAGTRQAAEYLLAAGHERVAFLGWPEDGALGDDRRRGWREALDAAGRSGLDLRSVDDVSAARATISEALLGEELTAVVCASDSFALGAYESARTAGVPLDVVGFDDTPVAAALGISSVTQPLTETAVAMMEAMQTQLDDEDAAPLQRLLQPRLIVRRPFVTSPTSH